MRAELCCALAITAVTGFVWPASGADVETKASYACTEGRTIDATYKKDSVDLILSDGRKLTLPQTVSGSGIRYANAQESIVYWSKGEMAFLTDGITSYSDCMQAVKK